MRARAPGAAAALLFAVLLPAIIRANEPTPTATPAATASPAASAIPAPATPAVSATVAPAASATPVASSTSAATTASRARAAALPAPVRVTARRVEYYGDAAIIVARGGVRVTEPDGSVVEGDVFVMNLGLRRLLVAGHVRLHTSAAVLSGAAFADFLVFRRQYFVPLEPEADRWTFFDYDYAHPKMGRQMPGDAFYIPDVSGVKPYIVGKAVTINASTYLRMAPAQFVLLDGALWTTPLPPYTYNFSANQNFGVNALPGASFDVPYNLAGSPASLDALHFRVDQNLAVKTYFAIEHHSLFDRGYAVFSLSPATQAQKQWNLLGYDRTSPVSAVRLTTQLFTYQYGLSQPLASSGYADVQYSQGVRQSALLADATQEYSSLLAQPALGYYGNPSHPWIPNHPFTLGVQWNGYYQKLLHTGFTYRLSSGYGMQYDSFGINGSGRPQVSAYSLGGSLFTPVYPGPFGTGINAAYSIGQTYFTFPNIVQAQNATATISRRVAKGIILVGSAVFTSASAQNGSAIISANQASGAVALPSSGNGLPVVLGPFLRATNRAYGLSTVWTSSPEFQFTVGATQNTYSPEQIPLVAGPPRYVLSGDVRVRVTRVLFVDVSRAYQFNWGGQPWSPQFQVLVTSQ